MPDRTTKANRAISAGRKVTSRKVPKVKDTRTEEQKVKDKMDSEDRLVHAKAELRKKLELAGNTKARMDGKPVVKPGEKYRETGTGGVKQTAPSYAARQDRAERSKVEGTRNPYEGMPLTAEEEKAAKAKPKPKAASNPKPKPTPKPTPKPKPTLKTSLNLKPGPGVPATGTLKVAGVPSRANRQKNAVSHVNRGSTVAADKKRKKQVV